MARRSSFLQAQPTKKKEGKKKSNFESDEA